MKVIPESIVHVLNQISTFDYLYLIVHRHQSAFSIDIHFTNLKFAFYVKKVNKWLHKHKRIQYESLGVTLHFLLIAVNKLHDKFYFMITQLKHSRLNFND